jgi:cyclophilin family peptidyl-prolyl cis-trans isomerase
MSFKLSVRDRVYWGTLLFAVIAVGYLLVTLVDLSIQEENIVAQKSVMRPMAKVAVVETSLGQIRIELFKTLAPVAVNNFASLAQAGFYDLTKVHRAIKGVRIEAGDPLSRESDRQLYGTGGPGYVFDDELHGQKLERGSVGMMNLGRPKTNGSQFFILVADSAPDLDGKNTVFGKVIKGMEVVDAMSQSQVDGKKIPKTPIVIRSITIE